MTDADPMFPATGKFPVLRNMSKGVTMERANVPLAVQRRLLRSSFYYTAMWLRERLDDDEFMDELEKLASERLDAGYLEYGSAMYDLSKEELEREVLEELADVFVWKSAEP